MSNLSMQYARHKITLYLQFKWEKIIMYFSD